MCAVPHTQSSPRYTWLIFRENKWEVQQISLKLGTRQATGLQNSLLMQQTDSSSPILWETFVYTGPAGVFVTSSHV